MAKMMSEDEDIDLEDGEEQVMVGWELDSSGKKKLPIVFNVVDYIDAVNSGKIKWAKVHQHEWTHHCRKCGTPMGEANKGWDYRCYDCYEYAEEDTDLEDEE